MVIVRLISRKRANQGAVFTLWTQPRVERPNVALSSWLSHDADQILRGAILLAHEYHVQVCAVTDVASANLTKGNNRQLFVPHERGCKNETRFSQIREFGRYGRGRSKSHNLA